MRTISGATSGERQAAVRLGAVSLELEQRNIRSLDTWAIPQKHPSLIGENKREFYQALTKAYNFDLERELQARKAHRDTATVATVEIVALQQRYGSDYYLLVPPIMESAAGFAKKCLDAEIAALSQLLASLSEQSSVGEWLHVASKDILERVRRAVPHQMQREEAARVGAPDPGPEENTSNEPQKGFSYLSPYELQQIRRELARGKARYAGDHLIEILLEHPEGVQILEAYAASPAQGTVASTTRVADALRALTSFADSAINKGKYLRYPFFVMGGVVELNLHQVPGFKEFAVQLTQLLARDWLESALSYGAIAVGCLSLAIAGPAVPAIALLLLAGTDLALSGMSLGVTFMREREQDLGSRGSAFRPQQFATPVIYTDTFLAAASALLSALAVFGAASQLRKVLDGPERVSRAVTPGPNAARSGGEALDARGLPVNRVGDPPVAAPSRSVGPTVSTPSPATRKVGEPIKGEAPATATGPEAQATSSKGPGLVTEKRPAAPETPAAPKDAKEGGAGAPGGGGGDRPPGGGPGSGPIPRPTLLQLQRAAALRTEAAEVERDVASLRSEAAEMMRSADALRQTRPDRVARFVRRAEQRRRVAALLEPDVANLRREAAEFESGARSATADLPSPEEIVAMLDFARSETELIRIPLGQAERNPTLLSRIVRELLVSRSGNRVVYRVEGGGSRQLLQVAASGDVTVARGETIYLNFGSPERALEFFNENRTAGARIVSFEVSEDWVRSLRSGAIPEFDTKALQGQPRLVDVRFAQDQMEIPGRLVDELQQFIVPGSGRVAELSR